MANTEKVATLDAEGLSLKSVSLWQITWRRLFKRKSAVVGLVILLFYYKVGHNNIIPVGDPKLKRGLDFRL